MGITGTSPVMTGGKGRLLRRDGCQFEHAAIFGGFGDIAAAQRKAHRVELANIVRRQIGRPSRVVLDQVDRNFSGVFALVDVFAALADHRINRCLKSSSHWVGSGRYAVTRTAGRRRPSGIPQTTWMGRPSPSCCKVRTL